MVDSGGLAREDATAEVDRYYVWPGQALGYKLGELKIRELRQKAHDALGERFDLRAFNQEILDHGALPLPVLERVIDAWIDRVKNGARACRRSRTRGDAPALAAVRAGGDRRAGRGAGAGRVEAAVVGVRARARARGRVGARVPRAARAPLADAPALAAHGATANSFAAAVRRAAPAVVSITASKTTLRRPRRRPRSPGSATSSATAATRRRRAWARACWCRPTATC